jgi:FkbM family methyltransferase
MLNGTICVIDGGACWGVFAKAILKQYSNPSLIYAIEPNPINLNVLHIEFGQNNRIAVIPKALFDQDNLVKEFYHLTDNINKFKEWGSLFPDNSERAKRRPDYNSVENFQVETITLETIIHNFSIPTIDILKLDIEGAERCVLTSLKPSTFSIIKQITVECHNKDTDKISSLLKDYKFKNITIVGDEVYGCH